ncbi:MAG: hypothetical protein WAT74_08565 [Flavobacteriales bacterium]
MATKQTTVRTRTRISKEGATMDKALKKATKRAVEEVFRVRDSILVERGGWLVYVNAKGEEVRRKRRIKPVVRPA